MPDLIVPARFCGPPSSGNGGWTAGALAALVDVDPTVTITVSLLAPPPLDTPMAVETVDGVTTATLDGREIARAEHGAATAYEGMLISTVDPAEARAAEASYAGLRSHPFPTCYACGTAREDGLRIFPGRVADQMGLPRVAATWTPDETVLEHPQATTWAALDCVGGWAGDLEERLCVLARMTASIDQVPEPGVEYVAIGIGRGREGRKTHTGSALVDPAGRVIAHATHLWVAVDPAQFA